MPFQWGYGVQTGLKLSKPHDALYKAHHVVIGSFEPVCKQYLTATKLELNGAEPVKPSIELVSVLYRHRHYYRNSRRHCSIEFVIVLTIAILL